MRLSCWKTIVSFLSLALFCAACTPEENKTDETEQGGKDKTVHVTGISLNKASATVTEGESIMLEATVTPDNAENKRVLWSSNNNTVATVDESGVVQAISIGSATITAKTEDAGKTATCMVTVKRNTALSITVGTDKLSAISVVLKGKANLPASVAADLKIGFQYSKSAGILPTNSTTVDAEDADADYNYTTGITGLDPETTYYFRSFVRQNAVDTYGETKSFTTKDVASLIETKDASEVEASSAKLNAKLDLTDVKYSSIDYGFYWGTSEGSQNSFLKGGNIADNAYTAVMANLSHKMQYWYKSYVKLDSQTFYGEVKTFTTDGVPVVSVSLDKTEYTFNTIGNTLALTATVLPANATDKSVEWTSDNTEVVTVDQNGIITAKSNGTATITVTTNDQGRTATCVVTVSQLITSISFDKTSLSLNEGEVFTLTATVNPNNAAEKTLKWTSTDESVATVDESGNVTAKSKGSATIKAEAQDGSGKYATCIVSVIKPVSSIELDKTSFVICPGKTEMITATVYPEDASDRTVTWTSSDTGIASVSSNGVVTGISAGKAIITATASDSSGKYASCEVEVLKELTISILPATKASFTENGYCFDPNERIVVNGDSYTYQVIDDGYAIIAYVPTNSDGYHVFYPASHYSGMNETCLNAIFSSSGEAYPICYSFVDTESSYAELTVLNALLRIRVSSSADVSTIQFETSEFISGTYSYVYQPIFHRAETGSWIQGESKVATLSLNPDDKSTFIILPPCTLNYIEIRLYDSNGTLLETKRSSTVRNLESAKAYGFNVNYNP